MSEVFKQEMNWQDFPNFTEAEFRCHCGCGGAPMDYEFVRRLQGIRDVAGPMRITSGYRCPDYNAKVSSTGRDGPHTTGKAADIACRGEQAVIILKEALNLGIKRVGVSQKGSRRFLHLDMSDRHPSPTIWSY